MDSQNKQNLISSQKVSSELALSENVNAQNMLDEMIVACMTVQKLYGRDVGNTETVIRIYQKILGNYRGDKVIRAFEIWIERSQEFPTAADIVNLVKRNGKPPLKESDIITIRKKDGEDRTPDDWATLREWDKQQQEGFGTDFIDEQKDLATMQENIQLRTEIRELKAEYARLAEILRQKEQSKGLPTSEIKLEDKLLRTVEFMKQNGASQIDIDEFLNQYAHAA